MLVHFATKEERSISTVDQQTQALDSSLIVERELLDYGIGVGNGVLDRLSEPNDQCLSLARSDGLSFSHCE